MKRCRLVVPVVLSVVVIGQGVIGGCGDEATPRDASFVHSDTNERDASERDAASDAGTDAQVVDAGVSDAVVDAGLPDTPA